MSLTNGKVDLEQLLLCTLYIALKMSQHEQSEVSSSTDSNAAKPKIRFRNYTPYDQMLLKKVETTKPVDSSTIEQEKSLTTTIKTKDLKDTTSTTTLSLQLNENPIEKELSKVVQQLSHENASNSLNTDLNIIPKKVNLDLKWHADQRIEKLRKRTQRAIVEILRERLSKEEALEGEEEESETSDDEDDD